MSTTLYCLAEDSVERERSLQHDIALSHGMDASTCWHLLGSLPPRADDKADLRRIEFTRKGRYHFERRKASHCCKNPQTLCASSWFAVLPQDTL